MLTAASSPPASIRDRQVVFRRRRCGWRRLVAPCRASAVAAPFPRYKLNKSPPLEVMLSSLNHLHTPQTLSFVHVSCDFCDDVLCRHTFTAALLSRAEEMAPGDGKEPPNSIFCANATNAGAACVSRRLNDESEKAAEFPPRREFRRTLLLRLPIGLQLPNHWPARQSAYFAAIYCQQSAWRENAG